MARTALITGITGQDGSYLAEFLLQKGYEVYGLVRRSSTPHYGNIAGILEQIHLIEGDLLDIVSLKRAIEQVQPDEIYNLAAQSHVGTSFEQPIYTSQVNALGVLNLLEALRALGMCEQVRFYQASTSEMYGNGGYRPPFDEDTPFAPTSPYAISKLYAHHLVDYYRKAYGLYGCCGILFNHESPRRGEHFVTRKIARGIARIKIGLADKIQLGNLSACRDWGYTPDYVRGMWLMLQQDQPRDYVLATGESHSVREFLIQAAMSASLPISDSIINVRTDLMRPSDVRHLCGDASLAREQLGWNPSVSFKELVHIMVQEELIDAIKERQKQESH